MATILWLTDNSRRANQLQHCEMDRYLRYHAGDHGYGWDAKALALPLVTGSYTHKAAEPLLRYAMDHDAPPPDDVIRLAIQAAQSEYRKVALVRGVEDRIDETGQQAFLLTEQQVLVEGLTWMLGLYIIPGILTTRRIISVEQDMVVVRNCTCGIGDGFGTQQDHEARDCMGIGWQSKLDFLTEDRSSGVLAYEELKTTSYPDKAWQESWERHPQLVSGVESAVSLPVVEGRDVPYAHIHGLVKGARRVDKFTNMRQQDSLLCYAWYREPNPPLDPGDIAWAYEYVDEFGKNRRLGKGYKKTPIWQIPFPDKPNWMSPSEYWIKGLPPLAVAKSYQPVGPIPVDRTIRQTFWQNVVASEEAWIEKLDKLAQSPAPWASPEFQRLLTETISRSWNCYPWNGKRCAYTGVCFKQDGWEDPIGSGHFVPRRPHHEAEMQQMADRGLTPPDAGWGEDEGDAEE